MPGIAYQGEASLDGRTEVAGSAFGSSMVAERGRVESALALDVARGPVDLISHPHSSVLHFKSRGRESSIRYAR